MYIYFSYCCCNKTSAVSISLCFSCVCVSWLATNVEFLFIAVNAGSCMFGTFCSFFHFVCYIIRNIENKEATETFT